MAQFLPLFCPAINRLLRSLGEQPNTSHLHRARNTPSGAIIIYSTRCHAPLCACLFDRHVIHACTSDSSIIVLAKERYKKRKLKVFILGALPGLFSVLLAKQNSQQAKILVPAAGQTGILRKDGCTLNLPPQMESIRPTVLLERCPDSIPFQQRMQSACRDI